MNTSCVILLLSECGEFCTERSHPGLPALRKKLRDALEKGERVEIHRQGVKLLTVSFIDELIPALALEFGLDVFEKAITFSPPLERIYLEQIKRGMRLRGNE